jgi:broad specificity phosphatase PhoE
MLTLYLLRHGEVHNPTGIIYGRLPGFGLSDNGRDQIDHTAQLLKTLGPFDALYASPMQRAQESAGLVSQHLDLPVRTEETIIETEIGTFQGKRFEDLPQPYITEERQHVQIEAAASMRARILSFVTAVYQRYPDGRVVAVSHRDPIIVALLHWQGRQLEELSDFSLEPGSAYEISLDRPDHATQVRAL